MSIVIESKGLHPTTVSCIEALQWLRERHACDNALDIGCGDGILALTAASLWKARVLAADIAPVAVDDTLANIALTQMVHLVRAVRSNGFMHSDITAGAPYDVIICNVLAEPLIAMIPDMARHLAPGGVCVISGILAWLAEDVQTQYATAGFTLLQCWQREQWVTYALTRANA